MLCLMASLSFGVMAMSIYDVQFTSHPGSDGTYPSRYVGKNVSLEGIVTATSYRNGGYFISEALNGPWRGILVIDRNSSLNPGDRVVVTGTVTETYGMTCLQDISQTRILESGAMLPHPVILTSGQLARADEAEAYEGVYARLLNVSAVGNKSLKDKFSVTDGSGPCTIIMGNFGERSKQKSPGAQYSSVTGIVQFGFSEFFLSPISSSDAVVYQPTFIQNRSWGKIKSIYK
jgi:hypothetical protein